MASSRLTTVAAAAAAGVAGLAARDIFQTKHALLRNFPLLARARYGLEAIGPELRQYIVASNNEERPFSRDQRRYVYSSAKGTNTYVGFGTDNDVENTTYPIVKHRTFADIAPASALKIDPTTTLPSAKVLGGPRGRRHAFRPNSVVNVSAMSFGSLSRQAIMAINEGARRGGFLHNTGEGGLSEHHRQGGELVFQVGTGYFGCRDENGDFDLERLAALVESAPVRAIEIKLSQGAKPGLGGHLPGAKVTEEIARIRGVEQGKDVASPARHSAFGSVDEMLDFVERVADRTGLPVGIKSAVGELEFWEELADLMQDGQRGVDFITIDGGEGGTGAAPLVFSDSVAFPFRVGFSEVYKIFARRGLTDRVTWIGAGKLGIPDNALVAFALGADMINIAREPMLAIGCIQAQKCHTGGCPTGVATQNPWLARGLVVEDKAERLESYVQSLRRDLLKVAEAAGVMHPGLLCSEDVEMVDGTRSHKTLREVYGYERGWGAPGPELSAEILAFMVDQHTRSGDAAAEEEVQQHAPLDADTDAQEASA